MTDLIDDLINRVPAHLIPHYNPHPIPPVSVRQVVQTINECEATGLDTSEFYAMLDNRQTLPIKLLKFKEDSVRPGYLGGSLLNLMAGASHVTDDELDLGTWTKTSRVVGPRTPFGLDTTLIQYDYDSEYEWEDEDPLNTAEDVNSGGERSEEEEEDGELSDGWLCEDDEVNFIEGYAGDDAEIVPMEIDEGNSQMAAARRKINEREKKSKSGKEAQKKKKTVGTLLPVIKGPLWEGTIGSSHYGPFKSMRIQFLNGSLFFFRLPHAFS